MALQGARCADMLGSWGVTRRRDLVDVQGGVGGGGGGCVEALRHLEVCSHTFLGRHTPREDKLISVKLATYYCVYM